MATKLKKMKLTSVDLVRAGANQEADICLYKSADPQEATEGPTEDEMNIFKRFIAFIRGTPTEAKNEPHSPIEKADEPADIESIYKSALVDSIHSIYTDDNLTEIEKKAMAEQSIGQFQERMKETLRDDDDWDDDWDDDDPDDWNDDTDDDPDDDRYDDIEEIEAPVQKYNHNHGRDGKFSTSGGEGGGAAPAAGSKGGKVKYASYADFPEMVKYDGEEYYKQSGAAGKMTTSYGGKAQSYVRWDDNNDEQYVEMNDRGEIDRG